VGRVAVILGSSAFAQRGEQIAAVAARHGAVVLQRHGTDGYRLPHLIDHAANLRSLVEAGCDRVLALSSVGSLDTGLPIGSVVCPDDFVALQLTISTRNDVSAHMPPGFDDAWRGEIVAAWEASGAGPLRDGAVYWQTNGPRFETPAEIRLIAPHADVVGMTVASECIVAAELGLRYAAVCMVDNLANGIGAQPLSTEDLETAREVNAGRLRDALDGALPELTR
jgi:5'-methylthioinosine phosphorylase